MHWAVPRVRALHVDPTRLTVATLTPCLFRCCSFIVFQWCDACGITGSGVLYGKGGRPPSGNDWYYQYDQGAINASRPKMLTVLDSRDFVMQDITILDAPFFNVYLGNVTGAEIGGVNITSTWCKHPSISTSITTRFMGTYLTDSCVLSDTDPVSGQLMEPHNTDGIDPGGGSSGIWIHDSFISNGDDSVAVKPNVLGSCTRDILVEDCVFKNGHGCSIGSVGSGCVENVRTQPIPQLITTI